MLQGSDGHSIEVAALLSSDHGDISGVIGSSADAGNIRGPLGDDFALMPHATSKFRYPEGFIGRGVELRLSQASEAGRWYVETVDHGCLEPQGPSTVTVKFKGEVHEVTWQVSGRELSVRVGSREITQLINRTIDPAALAQDIARLMLDYYNPDPGEQ
jgi:hypothetical protein